MKLTRDQEHLLVEAAMGSDRDRLAVREKLLASLGLSAGAPAQVFAREYIERAVESRNADDFEWGLTLAFHFGFAPELKPLLREQIDQTWHKRHEDLVQALDWEFQDPENAPAFYRATQFVPDYLEFDETRALAVKAIWGLGNIGGEEATAMLQQLAASDIEPIRDNARKQLKRLER